MNTYTPIGGMEIHDNDSGDYVAKPDYDALIQTLAQERQRREKAEERVNELRVRVNELRVRVVNDQNRRDLFKSSAIRLRDTRNWLLERVASCEAKLAEARKENERLRELWTEARIVMAQSRDANCVCAYGKLQADAVEAVNQWMNKMPNDTSKGGAK